MPQGGPSQIITKDTPGAVWDPGRPGGQGGGTPGFYRTKTREEISRDVLAQDAAAIAAGPPAPGMVFGHGTVWNPMNNALATPGGWGYPSTKGFFGDLLEGIAGIGKTVAPIALTALGANYLLPSLMGTAGAAGAAGAGGAGAAGAGALGADALLASELAAYPTAGIVGSVPAAAGLTGIGVAAPTGFETAAADLLSAAGAGAGAGLTSLAPEILTAGSAPGALAATLPAYVAPTAAELVAAGTTAGGTLTTGLGNEAVASGTFTPGSVGSVANAAGVLTPTQTLAAAGLPGLTSLTGADAAAAKLAASGNEAVASGMSPGSVGAAQAAAGMLTPAQLATASGVNSSSTLPDLSKVKLPGSDKSSGTGGLSALALAALLASMKKGSGTDDSYKGTIPEYDFSRTKNARPEKYRAGQGNVSYFTPGTYTAKAAGGGIMGLDDGGESSQFNFAEKDNYPSGSGYPSREVDQGGIVQQINPQFAGLGSLLQSANPPQDYNMAQGGAVPGQYNLGSYSDGGRLLKGPGDGVSDSIPAIIGEKQPARLATGEFVIPARIVSELGNGSTEAGAQRLYEMMKRIQQTRRKTKNVAANTNAAKYLPA